MWIRIIVRHGGDNIKVMMNNKNNNKNNDAEVKTIDNFEKNIFKTNSQTYSKSWRQNRKVGR